MPKSSTTGNEFQKLKDKLNEEMCGMTEGNITVVMQDNKVLHLSVYQKYNQGECLCRNC